MTYETQGQCDRCQVPAGQLVNGLVLCACLTGLGAPWQTCECHWGHKRRRAYERATAPTVSSRGDLEETGAVGAGRAGREARPPAREPTGPE